MLFTMMSERVAVEDVAGEGMRESNDIKIVVFPEPVGSDTPILECPERRASRQASTHCSW